MDYLAITDATGSRLNASLVWLTVIEPWVANFSEIYIKIRKENALKSVIDKVATLFLTQSHMAIRLRKTDDNVIKHIEL